MIAQEDKLKQLMRSVRAGRIVHALLFTGPEGTGKKTAAHFFAQAMLCTSENAPCGECAACKRVLAGAHPDLHILTPEKKLIRVDDVRTLISDLGLNAYEGGHRIALITPADAMNEQAQNALLKTLEEPPKDVLFILTATHASSMLPTIRSRCRELRFSPLSVRDCAEILTQKGLTPENAAELAGLGEGSVGRALALDGDDKFRSRRESILNALELRLKGRPVSECLSEVEFKKGDTIAPVLCDILQLWARDLMAVQNDSVPFEIGDTQRLRRMDLSGTALMQLVIRARKQLASNVSAENVFTDLFFHIQRRSRT